MTEKSTGKFILQLEESFAHKNPILLQTARAYHELDQINYDLGLLDMDDSVASKISWWPVISCIGSASSGKLEFINQLHKADILQIDTHATHSKFSVLFQGNNDQVRTLPGTAVDQDPRLPFYHFSDKIDLLEEGEGRQINNYLELKTCASRTLNGKIFISAPGFNADRYDRVTPYLVDHLCHVSDLVLVFFSADETDFEPVKASLNQFINSAHTSQNTDKFIFIISQQDPDGVSVDLVAWKARFAEQGLNFGRFFSLQKVTETHKPAKDNRLFAQVTDFGGHDKISSSDLQAIEKLIDNVDIDSAYRIVGSLDSSIHAVDEEVMQEVRNGIKKWKDRSHFTLTLFLSTLAIILVMAELQIGFLALLIDPIIGPIALISLIAITTPLHIYSSKQHAKWVAKDLQQRQKELGLVENIADVFEKNVTLWRMLLPIKQPVGWNKDIQARLTQMLDRSKELVQALNDSFSLPGSKSF